MAAEGTGKELEVAVLSPAERAALFGAAIHCLQGDDLHDPPPAVVDAARGMLDEVLALIDHGTSPVRHSWIGGLSLDWREILFAALLASVDDRHQGIDLLSEARWDLLQGLFDTLNMDDGVAEAMGWDPPRPLPAAAP